MVNPLQKLRQVHRQLAPIIVLPLILSVLTGTLYQIALLGGQAGDYFWLIEVHKGHFGPVNLERIYPFLNGLGLLVMSVTGISLWWRMRRRPTTR